MPNYWADASAADHGPWGSAMIARREMPRSEPRPGSPALRRARRVVAAVLLRPGRRRAPRRFTAAGWLFSAAVLALMIACLVRIVRLFW
jgi:hypothetical protein